MAASLPHPFKFLKYVDGLPAKDKFVNELQYFITKLKNSEKEKVNYVTYQMKIADERAEAEAKGRKEGEGRLARLMSLLLKSGKTEEATAASESEQLREELYKKYGIA